MGNSQFDSLIILARRDFHTAKKIADEFELRSVAFFHVQQALEKAFKAVLSARDVPYPMTHDLLVLKDRLAAIRIQCPLDDDVLDQITPFGVVARYDDGVEPPLSITQGLAIMSSVLAWAEQHRPSSPSST